MTNDLGAVLAAQQRGCRAGGSELYVTVLAAVADDVTAGGPCAAVLGPFADEDRTDALVLRFLAAVHELVLSGGAEALARHYPSTGGSPGPDLGAAFVEVVAANVDRLRVATARPIQTNEPGRSASLVGGFLVLAGTGLPLRVLEVGASAGLNLHFDRYRYVGRTGAFGPEDSPVVFAHPWATVEPRLDVALAVAERRGCDTAPLDPAVADDRLRLRACLWPDQPQRRDRLEAALAVARAHPVTVEEADAVDWLGARLSEPVPGTTTVVVHSIVAQYFGRERRAALERLVADAGARATIEAPVAWLRMEPASVDEAEVRLTLWPRPTPVRDHVLARGGFHGPPVRWGSGGRPAD